MSNKHQHNHLRTASGYTLVEVIVTILVSVTFIFAFNTVYTTQVFISQSGRDTTVANSYVEGKFESLRSQGFLGIPDGTTDITNELPNELNAPKNASLVISSFNSATKLAVINMTFNLQGTDQTFNYSTYIGELGVGQY